MTKPLFALGADASGSGMESLFATVFEPNPRLVSKDPGVIVHPDPATSVALYADQPIRVVVDKLWTDSEGNTIAEGTIVDGRWDKPGADPVGDMHKMWAKMRQQLSDEELRSLYEVTPPPHPGITFIETARGGGKTKIMEDAMAAAKDAGFKVRQVSPVKPVPPKPRGKKRKGKRR